MQVDREPFLEGAASSWVSPACSVSTWKRPTVARGEMRKAYRRERRDNLCAPESPQRNTGSVDANTTEVMRKIDKIMQHMALRAEKSNQHTVENMPSSKMLLPTPLEAQMGLKPPKSQ